MSLNEFYYALFNAKFNEILVWLEPYVDERLTRILQQVVELSIRDREMSLWNEFRYLRDYDELLDRRRHEIARLVDEMRHLDADREGDESELN